MWDQFYEDVETNRQTLEALIGMRLVHIYGLPSYAVGERTSDPLYREWCLLMEDGANLHVFAFEVFTGLCDEGRLEYGVSLDSWSFSSEVVQHPFGRSVTSVEYVETPRKTRCGYWEAWVDLTVRFGDCHVSFFKSSVDYDALEDGDAFFYRIKVREVPEFEWGEYLQDWRLTAINTHLSA